MEKEEAKQSSPRVWLLLRPLLVKGVDLKCAISWKSSSSFYSFAYTLRVGGMEFFVISLEAPKIAFAFEWDFNSPHSPSYSNRAIVRVVLYYYLEDVLRTTTVLRWMATWARVYEWSIYSGISIWSIMDIQLKDDETWVRSPDFPVAGPLKIHCISL